MSIPTDAAIRVYAADLVRSYAAGFDYLDLAEHMADDDTIDGTYVADLNGPEIDDLQRRILDAVHAWGADAHAAGPLRLEYGIRAEWISTLSSEGPVAKTLGDALEALAAFDTKHGDRVVSRTLIERPVGNWRVLGDDGRPQQPADGADSHADATGTPVRPDGTDGTRETPEAAATGTQDDGVTEMRKERDDYRAQLRTELSVTKALLRDKDELIMRAHHAEVRAETAERELARQREVNCDVAKQCLRAMGNATAAERALAEVREQIGTEGVEPHHGITEDSWCDLLSEPLGVPATIVLGDMRPIDGGLYAGAAIDTVDWGVGENRRQVTRVSIPIIFPDHYVTGPTPENEARRQQLLAELDAMEAERLAAEQQPEDGDRG